MKNLETLNNIENVSIEFSCDLSRFTTTKLKSIGTLITIGSIPGLKEVIRELKKQKIAYQVLGLGANSLLAEFSDTIYLKLNFIFKESYFDKARESYNLPASIRLNKLSAHAIKFGIKGWECFTGIPGTLGGAIFMNAGTSLGEIGALVEEVTILDVNLDVKKIALSSQSFSYRKNLFLKDSEVIISAKIKSEGIDRTIPKKIKDYLEYRKETQPLWGKNCGCVFKNDPSFQVGLLIDKVGLKGFRSDHFQISEKHANFIEHLGGGTLENYLEFIEKIKFLVNLYSGVKLECEVRY
jgi:UDP-N-acetylmuramate dehydrogenase